MKASKHKELNESTDKFELCDIYIRILILQLAFFWHYASVLPVE